MVHGQRESITLSAVQNKISYLKTRAVALLVSVACIFLFSACAAPLAVLSSSGSAAASSVGSAAAANPGTAVSLASSAATGKSPLEHAASAATKKECSFFNLIDSKPICIEVTFPTITDKSEPLFGPADISSKSAQQ